MSKVSVTMSMLAAAATRHAVADNDDSLGIPAKSSSKKTGSGANPLSRLWRATHSATGLVEGRRNGSVGAAWPGDLGREG